MQAASSPVKASHQNMPQNFNNSTMKFQFKDDDILVGLKFKMQYLGCGEELRFGGTDHEIANVIHDIHTLYSGRNTKLSKARSVVVFVDTVKINIFNENEDELLLTFPLVYVKDVTTCLEQAPYSNTCVLVARQYNEPLYKAFVFYSKSPARASKFYHFTTSAFQLGFKRMETFTEGLDSNSTAEEPSSECSTPNGSVKKLNGDFDGAKNCARACFDEEDGDCDSLSEFGKGFPESEKLLKSGIQVFPLKAKGKKKKVRKQTITVQISNNENDSFEKREKRRIKFNLNLGDESNLNPSKFGGYMDTIGESSRFLIPHWFRNSYMKFRKIGSRQPPSGETTEDVGQI